MVRGATHRSWSRRYSRAPEHANTTRVALDAKDAGALAAAVWGAAVIYNCADLGDYRRWSAEGPPLAASMLAEAAESSRAVLVTFGNLYG